MAFVIKRRDSRSAGEDVHVRRTENDVWRQPHNQRGHGFRIRERERGRNGSDRAGHRYRGSSDRQEARHRPANSTREHYCQTHCRRKADAGTQRPQTLY